jgi:hypothetical protein
MALSGVSIPRDESKANHVGFMREPLCKGDRVRSRNERVGQEPTRSRIAMRHMLLMAGNQVPNIAGHRCTTAE